MFYTLVLFCRAGCSWDVLDQLIEGSPVSGRTVRRRLRLWRRAGVLEEVADDLMEGLPTPEVGFVDATFVRSRGGGTDAVGLTRHGKGSKLQVIVDCESRPIAFHVASANPAESRLLYDLLAILGVKIPPVLVGDKAYDVDDLRRALRDDSATLVAPHRKNRKRPAVDQELVDDLYRERWRVERSFSWMAGYRRVVTRYERSLAAYRTWVCLAVSLMLV